MTTGSFSATFGQRLRTLRQRRMLTQAELAELVGVDQRVISRWETDVTRPHLRRQRALCQALGVTGDDPAASADASADADGAPPSESCPLCGDDVSPAEGRADGGVPWGHHHAHALCALENLAARVADLERVLSRHHPWPDS